MAMASQNTASLANDWPTWQKNTFRFFFVYFIIQTIPLDWKFYGELFTLNWRNPELFHVLNLTRYAPQFLSATALSSWGIASFANWGVAILLALLGAVAWGYTDRKTRNYDQLYYYLRVLLRYRLALGVITYGLIKLFPLQIPPPTLSELHTNYGDFYAWKIYYLTTGLAANHYESSLGLIEILGGILLLYRRTATIGAGLVAAFLVNVVTANFAYYIGDHVYSTYMLVIALFLLAYDVPRLYVLFASSKPAIANRFKPFFVSTWQSTGRQILKYGFLVLLLLIGLNAYNTYMTEPYVKPRYPGLAQAEGFYNVREFRLNQQLIPYATDHPERWQNVVFEKWNTLSIKNNKPGVINASLPVHDRFDGSYEHTGNGGRHFYNYQTDAVSRHISLTNKNLPGQKFSLKYEMPDDSTIVLSGVTDSRDSVFAVLEKIDKKYLLLEGRRKPISL
jgi:hypothetical protein